MKFGRYEEMLYYNNFKNQFIFYAEANSYFWVLKTIILFSNFKLSYGNGMN